MGDAPPAPAVFFSERKHCLFHLLWGLAGRALGTAGSIHKACFPLSEEAPDSPPRRIAGDGKSSGCFPEATTLLEGAYDLQSELHFALLVGELVSFGECKCQQGGIPPFLLVWMNLPIGGMPHFFKNSSNAERSGLGGGSPCPGLFTSLA